MSRIKLDEDYLASMAGPLIVKVMQENELDIKDKQLLHAMIMAFQAGIKFWVEELGE